MVDSNSKPWAERVNRREKALAGYQREDPPVVLTNAIIVALGCVCLAALGLSVAADP